jgi:hypothetical protein
MIEKHDSHVETPNTVGPAGAPPRRCARRASSTPAMISAATAITRLALCRIR